MSLPPLQCPKGHNLPFSLDGKFCSAVTCAAEFKAAAEGRDPARVPKVRKRVKLAEGFDKTNPESAESARRTTLAAVEEGAAQAIAEIDLGEESALVAEEAAKTEGLTEARKAGRHAARKAMVRVPENLEGSAANDWAAGRMLQLAPRAVAEAEYRLRFGDDDQRWEAAKFVMDATGHGKRDANGNMAMKPSIVVLGGIRLPWLPKQVEKQIEDAVVVATGETARGDQKK